MNRRMGGAVGSLKTSADFSSLASISVHQRFHVLQFRMMTVRISYEFRQHKTFPFDFSDRAEVDQITDWLPSNPHVVHQLSLMLGQQ